MIIFFDSFSVVILFGCELLVSETIINKLKLTLNNYRAELGCNEVTFGDCNLDVGGVLGTLYNISAGKNCFTV
jgi:hypothetical protein